MFKKILLVALLAPSLALAQQPDFVRNDSNTTTLNGVNLRASSAAVTDKGVVSVAASDPSSGEQQSVIPVSNATNLNGLLSSINGYFNVGTDTIEAASTTTVLNLTSHAAREGDTITPTGGTAANIDVEVPVCSVTANTVTLCKALPATPSTDAITIRRPKFNYTPKEDSAHISGDTGFAVWGVRKDTAGGVSSNDGDYTQISVNAAGATLVDINSDFTASTAKSILKLEDSAASTGDALVGVASIRQDTFNTTGGNGDYVPLTTDTSGRLAVNAYGAGVGEFWQSCGTATATTGDTAIKAAVASNRIYVTAITCKNTSATVATSLDFKDGTTVIAVGGISQMATTAPGSFTATFPVPLRGTSNTALNFATNISVSSVTCCASGYISVN